MNGERGRTTKEARRPRRMEGGVRGGAIDGGIQLPFFCHFFLPIFHFSSSFLFLVVTAPPVGCATDWLVQAGGKEGRFVFYIYRSLRGGRGSRRPPGGGGGKVPVDGQSLERKEKSNERKAGPGSPLFARGQNTKGGKREGESWLGLFFDRFFFFSFHPHSLLFFSCSFSPSLRETHMQKREGGGGGTESIETDVLVRFIACPEIPAC